MRNSMKFQGQLIQILKLIPVEDYLRFASLPFLLILTDYLGTGRLPGLLLHRPSQGLLFAWNPIDSQSKSWPTA